MKRIYAQEMTTMVNVVAAPQRESDLRVSLESATNVSGGPSGEEKGSLSRVRYTLGPGCRRVWEEGRVPDFLGVPEMANPDATSQSLLSPVSWDLSTRVFSHGKRLPGQGIRSVHQSQFARLLVKRYRNDLPVYEYPRRRNNYFFFILI